MMFGAEDGDEDAEQDAIDIFQEPQGYFKSEQPFTFTTFEMDNGRNIPLRLVGESPLWANHLWNGAKVLSDHLQQNVKSLVKDRTILELGAGAGLPSLVCATLGAKYVLVTDYPDPELIENLQYNVSQCTQIQAPSDSPQKQNITAAGYLWGADVQPLFENILVDGRDSSAVDDDRDPRRFETLLLADILYNHSEHGKLVRTIRSTMARTADARALVFFTPYRPWLLERDLAFFDICRGGPSSSDEKSGSPGGVEDVDLEKNSAKLGVEKICENTLPKVMFENDRGDETLRRTVFGYEIFWADLRS